MKKKKFLLITTSILSFGTISLALLSGYDNNYIFAKGDQNSESYRIVCNSTKNKFFAGTGSTGYSGNATIKTDLDNDINFTYSDVAGGSSSVWHLIRPNGYFYNTTPIHGLSQVTIVSTSNDKQFTIYWGSDTDYTLGSESVSSSVEGTSFSFNGDNPTYFKIINTSVSNLSFTNIDINFACQNNYPVLNISSENEDMGTVSGGGTKVAGQSVTIVATPKSGYKFVGWYSGSELISSDASYTFIMPANDYSLEAIFMTQEWDIAHGVIPSLSDDGKTLTYGLYPQKNVNDSSLISALNALTTPESNGWYLYEDEYYAKVSATPYSTNLKFDNGTTIVSATTYWFECEPITWNVLSNNDGEYYILSSVLLDAHRFSEIYSGTKDGRYANNYEYSEIRAWLNNEFYNSAFALGNSNIQLTNVNNGAATTDSYINPYACNNTQDKVFLPSYRDYINSSYGFSTSTGSTSTRYCKTTDWARARGADYIISGSYLHNGYYWTRSPRSGYSNDVWCVNGSGILGSYNLNVTSNSVRPSLSIKIA